MFPALGAVLGLLRQVAGGVLWRGLKFQTCTNTLNKFFLTIQGIFGCPHIHIYCFTGESNSYACEMRVKTHNNLSEPVETALGLNQEDAMSCVLLNTALEKVGRELDLLILS